MGGEERAKTRHAIPRASLAFRRRQASKSCCGSQDHNRRLYVFLALRSSYMANHTSLGTMKYSIAKAVLPDDVVRHNLSSAQQRKHRTLTLPSNVTMDKAREYWENLSYNPKLKAVTKEFKSSHFCMADPTIQRYRDISNEGRVWYEERQKQMAGKPKIVLGQGVYEEDESLLSLQESKQEPQQESQQAQVQAESSPALQESQQEPQQEAHAQAESSPALQDSEQEPRQEVAEQAQFSPALQETQQEPQQEAEAQAESSPALQDSQQESQPEVQAQAESSPSESESDPEEKKE
jgi:hypothetical protein